jgi:[ribosomal protein S18]-alanine N-acetyltransferase
MPKSPNATPVNVRPAIPEDIPRLTEIERPSGTAAHWTEEQYRHAIQGADDLPERLVLVAASGDPSRNEVNPSASPPQEERRQGQATLAGFLAARRVDREWELENIVVAPEFRGRGMATRLVEVLLARVRALKGSAVFLEVRESNSAARKLYESAGFRASGRRRLYYSHPSEDAVLYCKNVL